MLKNLACTAMVLAIATAANAQIWNEQGDAGALPATAQTPTGNGALTTISGNNSGGDVDMFEIQVNGGTDFSATTEGGGTTFDTQLFLFDSNGLGVLGNDDTFPSGAPFLSTLLSSATDGTGSTVTPGTYYLAISGFNNDPSSAGGPIFDQGAFDEQSGPDGSGGGSAVTGWSGGGGPGSYNIGLTGVKYVPEPATLSLLAIGAMAMIRRRR
jgi:pre-peptidase/PEP-CTERM motif-containing protein